MPIILHSYMLPGAVSTLTVIASIYAQLVKRADIAENMALRIMLSLIPALSDPLESAMIAAHNKGVFDDNALFSVIPGARELVKYGAMACERELLNYNRKFEVSPINRLMRSGRYLDALGLGKDLFYDVPNWDHGYGGEGWAKIAGALISIGKTLTKIDASKNVEEKIDITNNLIVEMNVLDGICHNTGSIMQKMYAIQKEKDDADNDYRIRNLMDIKEVMNPYDVLKEVSPYIKKDPALMHSFRKWVGRPGKPSEPHQLSSEIAKIRVRRELSIANNSINTILAKLNSLGNNNAGLQKELLEGMYFSSIPSVLDNLIIAVKILAKNNEDITKQINMLKSMYFSVDAGKWDKWEEASAEDFDVARIKYKYILNKTKDIIGMLNGY